MRKVLVALTLLSLYALPGEAQRRRAVPSPGRGPCTPSSTVDCVIAFVSERDGNSEIYVINSDGSGLRRLTDAAGFDGDPAWSPDGNRIAFASDRAGESDIYVMDADGGNVVRRTESGSNSGPAWSPDGKRIAFSSLREGRFGFQFAIYVMDVDGNWTHPTLVGYERGWNTHPAWSADGERIAFVSDWELFDFFYDVYIVRAAEGTQIARLFSGGFETYHYQPSFSRDGSRVAVVVCPRALDNCYPNSSIAIANTDGSNVRTLVQAGGYARPTWSPDSSTIAFASQACRSCVPELRYVSADGSRSGVIFENGHHPAWRP